MKATTSIMLFGRRGKNDRPAGKALTKLPSILHTHIQIKAPFRVKTNMIFQLYSTHDTDHHPDPESMQLPHLPLYRTTVHHPPNAHQTKTPSLL